MDTDIAREVWRSGALVFGDKWRQKHGDRPQGEWLNVFMNIDHQNILRGLKRMRDDAEAKIRAQDDPWPPTAFEFAIYCKPEKNIDYGRNQVPERLLLPRKDPRDGMSYEQCRDELKRMGYLKDD